jgi:hypothetical protein
MVEALVVARAQVATEWAELVAVVSVAVVLAAATEATEATAPELVEQGWAVTAWARLEAGWASAA